MVERGVRFVQLYDTTWASYYRSEPTVVQYGTKERPEPPPPPPKDPPPPPKDPPPPPKDPPPPPPA